MLLSNRIKQLGPVVSPMVTVMEDIWIDNDNTLLSKKYSPCCISLYCLSSRKILFVVTVSGNAVMSVICLLFIGESI